MTSFFLSGSLSFAARLGRSDCKILQSDRFLVAEDSEECESQRQGFGDRESIQLGLSATGGTISAAGLILGLTFLALVLTSAAGHG